jgi:formate dehydrogenase iron-sulfur subunit
MSRTDDNPLYGPRDPAAATGYAEPPKRKGFFTDTSICIGCKACEVACKEWNDVPEDGLVLTGMSYDNTQGLGASTWRHVAFIEQVKPLRDQPPNLQREGVDVLALTGTSGTRPAHSPALTPTTPPVDLGMPAPVLPGSGHDVDRATPFRWLMESDVCKHCTHAGCLDICPTGSLFRTEFGTVVVQDDICNGCGYCVPACPYGVIERREAPGQADATSNAVGIAQKCTLCYDRLLDDHEPACAKACPTDSIQFGDLDELRERAQRRLDKLVEAGQDSAQLYGQDAGDGVGGTGAFFLLLDEPEVYGLPPDPVVPTRDLAEMWRRAGLAALGLLAGTTAIFSAGRRP